MRGLCNCAVHLRCCSPPRAPRAAFVLAGIAVQALGLALVFRAHFSLEGER